MSHKKIRAISVLYGSMWLMLITNLLKYLYPVETLNKIGDIYGRNGLYKKNYPK